VTARAPLRLAPGHRNIARELAETWQARDLLYTFADRDLRLRYRQTALGVVWVVLQPLIAAGIFTFVFGTVAHLSSEGKPYLLFTFAALTGWNLFSGILTRASACLVGNANLVSRVYFPRLLLPLSVIPAALVDFAVSLGMLATLRSGTSMYSAIVPGRCSPNRRKWTQRDCSPRRQYSQVPSLIPGLTITRSSVPSTIPTASAPMIHGGVTVAPGSPFRTKRSR